MAEEPKTHSPSAVCLGSMFLLVSGYRACAAVLEGQEGVGQASLSGCLDLCYKVQGVFIE